MASPPLLRPRKHSERYGHSHWAGTWTFVPRNNRTVVGDSATINSSFGANTFLIICTASAKPRTIIGPTYVSVDRPGIIAEIATVHADRVRTWQPPSGFIAINREKNEA